MISFLLLSPPAPVFAAPMLSLPRLGYTPSACFRLVCSLAPSVIHSSPPQTLPPFPNQIWTSFFFFLIAPMIWSPPSPPSGPPTCLSIPLWMRGGLSFNRRRVFFFVLFPSSSVYHLVAACCDLDTSPFLLERSLFPRLGLLLFLQQSSHSLFIVCPPQNQHPLPPLGSWAVLTSS